MNLPNAENLIESLKNKINAIIDSNTVLIGVQRGGELILQKILPDLKEHIATGSINEIGRASCRERVSSPV